MQIGFINLPMLNPCLSSSKASIMVSRLMRSYQGLIGPEGGTTMSPKGDSVEQKKSHKIPVGLRPIYTTKYH